MAINILNKTLLIVFFILIVTIIGGTGCMANQTLQMNDKELLNDSDKLNQTIIKDGWPFNDKKFQGNKITNLKIINTTIRNVQFTEGVLEKILIKNTTIEDTDFNHMQLNNFILDNVTFKNCRFIETKFNNSKFSNCHFKDVLIFSVDLKNNIFHDSDFIGLTTQKPVSFEKSEFHNITFKNSKLEDVDFYSSQFNNIKFNNNEMKNFGTEDAKIKKIDIVDCTISSSSILGDSEEINIESCKFDGFGFNDSNIINLKISNCDKSLDLSINDTNCKDLNLENNKIDGLYLSKSMISNLNIKTCAIMKFICHGTNFKGNNFINDSTLLGFDLKKVKVNNLDIENTSFKYKIVLREATIENLKLNNIKYLKDDEGIINLFTRGVQYINSDHFPTEGANVISN